MNRVTVATLDSLPVDRGVAAVVGGGHPGGGGGKRTVGADPRGPAGGVAVRLGWVVSSGVGPRSPRSRREPRWNLAYLLSHTTN